MQLGPWILYSRVYKWTHLHKSPFRVQNSKFRAFMSRKNQNLLPGLQNYNIFPLLSLPSIFYPFSSYGKPAITVSTQSKIICLHQHLILNIINGLYSPQIRPSLQQCGLIDMISQSTRISSKT